MVQKSGVHQLRLVKYPIICRVLAPTQTVVVGLGISGCHQRYSLTEVQPQRENMDQDLLRVVKALEQVQRMSHTFPPKKPKLTIKNPLKMGRIPQGNESSKYQFSDVDLVFRGRHA